MVHWSEQFILDETIEENKPGGVNFDVEFSPKKKKEAQRRGIYLSRTKSLQLVAWKILHSHSLHNQFNEISFKRPEQADFLEKHL